MKTIKGHALRGVSYTFKRGRSGATTLKLTMTVANGHGRRLKRTFVRHYRLCAPAKPH